MKQKMFRKCLSPFAPKIVETHFVTVLKPCQIVLVFYQKERRDGIAVVAVRGVLTKTNMGLDERKWKELKPYYWFGCIG
jgi:hypothetical protein